MILQLEIDGKFYGNIILDERHAEAHRPVCSRAFFCPWCVRIWARAWSPGLYCDPTIYPCRNCRKLDGSANPPGSIWVSWDPVWLNALPREVILREFDLHLTQWEKDHETRLQDPSPYATAVQWHPESGDLRSV